MNEYDAAWDASLKKPSSEYDAAWENTAPKAETKTKSYVEPVTDFSGNLRLGPLDTGIALPQAVNKGLAQFGSGYSDLAQGLKQRLGMATEAETSEKRKIDAVLNEGVTGKINNFSGKVAPWLAAPVSSAYPMASMVLGGLFQGLLEPTVKGESPAWNAANGAALSSIIPGGMKAYEAVAKNKASDELARKAIEMGIPLSVADTTNSKFLKGFRSILNDLPITGTIGAAQNQAKTEGFTRAVSKTMGENTANLGPDVMLGAKARIGGSLDDVWGRNTVPAADIFTSARALSPRVGALAADDQAKFWGWVDSAISKQKNGLIPGEAANVWQSDLRRQAEGTQGVLGDILNTLRQDTLKAFNRNVVNPKDAQQLATGLREYKAYKTLEPIMNKAEAGVAGRLSGDVPAALLPGQVAQQYGAYLNQSPFKDLSPIAGRFMVDRTPQTGGSVRALIQNAVSSPITGAMAAIGGASQFGVLPVAGAAALGSGMQYAMGPEMARRMLLQQVPRGLLDKPDALKALKEIASTGVQRMPAALGLTGLLGLPAFE